MKYKPEYISCTYGAGGGNVGANREVCQMIKNAGTAVAIAVCMAVAVSFCMTVCMAVSHSILVSVLMCMFVAVRMSMLNKVAILIFD